MKKSQKLKICNWTLLITTIAILVSAIELEVTDSRATTDVWLHILIGLTFSGLVGWHIYLHFGQTNWAKKVSQQKKQLTRILWWIFLLTFISGIIATIHWLDCYIHSPIGGIHGKIGFLMIALSIGHICKRYKFFN